MSGILYDIIARADNTGFDQAEAAIDRMTGAQVRWNAAANRWQSESGRFVAANNVSVGSMGRLGSSISGVALTLAGTAGLAVALMAAHKLQEEFREGAEKLFNRLRYGVEDIENVRKAAQSVYKIEVAGLQKTLQSLNDVRLELVRQRAELLKLEKETTSLSPRTGGDVSTANQAQREEMTRRREMIAVLEAEAKALEERNEQARIAGATPPVDPPKPLKESVTLLGKLTDAQADLKDRLAELEGPRGIEIAQLQRANDELEKSIGVKQRLNALDAEGNRTISGLLGLEPAALNDAVEGVDKLEQISNRYTNALAKLQSDANRALQEQLAVYDRFQEGMDSVLVQGFTSLTETVLSGSGSFGGAMGDFLITAGRATIAAAPISELVDWRKLMALGAPGMLAAGAGMIAVGSLLRRQFASAHADSFGGAAGGVSASELLITSSAGSSLAAANGGYGSFGGSIASSMSDAGRLATVLDRLERNGLTGTLTTERGAFKAELVQQRVRDQFTDVYFYH